MLSFKKLKRILKFRSALNIIDELFKIREKIKDNINKSYPEEYFSRSRYHILELVEDKVWLVNFLALRQVISGSDLHKERFEKWN